MSEGLSEAGRATILRSFTARQAELAEERETAGTTWRWTNGIYLFPEGRCPYCRGIIHSDRIWVIEEDDFAGRYRLTGRFKLSHGRLVREPADHPHVNGGHICMGNSRSAAHALFYGMNPGSAYNADPIWWQRWMKRVWCGHECEELTRLADRRRSY